MKIQYSKYKPSGVEWIGELPYHWMRIELRYVLELLTDFESNGSFSSVKENVNVDNEGPVWYVRMTDLENGNIRNENCKYCDMNTYEFLVKTRVYGGELLITKRGEIGKVYLFPENCGLSTLGPNSYLLRLQKDKVHSSFLYYFYISVCGQITLKLLDNSTTIGSLYKDDIKGSYVVIPPLYEQKKIVEYLNEKTTEINNLIKITENKIDLLKEKRIFILNKVVTTGLNPHVDLKDSGVEWIGLIPKHWNTKPLKSLVLSNLNTLPENTDPNYELNYIEISDVDSSGNIKNTTPYYFKESPSRCRRVLNKGDVFISTVRTYLKSIGYVKQQEENLICSTGFCVLTPKEDIQSEYLFYIVSSEWFISEVISKSEGVSYPSITSTDLINIKVILPPESEQEEIVKYIDNKTKEIDKLLLIENRRIDMLKEYRQSLISEVVTGKIRVCNDDISNKEPNLVLEEN